LELSAEFINLPLDEIDLHVFNALEKMANFVGVDRAYIFDYDFNANTSTNTHEWCAPDILPQINELQGIPINFIPDWPEAHTKGEYILIQDISALDEGPLRDILLPQDIQSLVTFPLFINSKCTGFVGFDAVKIKHNFSSNEIAILEHFSKLLSNIADRKHKEEDLFLSNKRFQLSEKVGNVGTWEYLIVKNEFWVSAQAKIIFGATGEDFIFTIESIESCMPEKKRVHQALVDLLEKDVEYNIEYEINPFDGSSIKTISSIAEVVRDESGVALKVVGSIHDISQKHQLKLELEEERQRFMLAIEGTQDGLWDWHIKTNEAYMSDRYSTMLGYEVGDLPSSGEAFTSLIHPDDIEKAREVIQEYFKAQGKIPYNNTFRMATKDGTYKWISGRGKALFNKDGEPERFVGFNTDITQKIMADEELNISKDMFEKAFNNTPNIILISNIKTGLISDVNKTFQTTLKYKKEDVVGKTALDIGLWHNLDDRKKYIEDIGKYGHIDGDIYDLNTKDNKLLTVQVYSSLFSIGNDEYILAVLEDITERKNTENKLLEQKGILHHQAHHDALTGLPNRVLFNDRLLQAIEIAKRNKTNIALLFIDLDHFKEINDSLGHSFGDEILKTISKRLIEVTRDIDCVSRLGGDEFTVILENLSQIQDASLIADKIINALSKSITIGDNKLYVSCSIGISIYPDDGKSAQNLLKFADSAMFKAKDEGRNNYQYYNATMTELAFERLVMETSLRSALKNEEFVVYYQAQVNGATDKLIGMEALVRWQHPTMGLVSPAKFIPLAESTGLIVELDRFVMKTAMTQLSLWYKEGLNPGKLAMNLAVKQLKRDDFIETIQNLIKETECQPEWLELEVTEGQIMTNPDEAIKTLQHISDIGIKLAVDDFGTGYSSLAYLKRLPIDKLKIDQAFIRNLPDDEDDSAITKAIIALGHSLNLRVIAEGVETKEQRDFIVENGCKSIQGYFYSKPIPAKEFEVLLKDGLFSELSL